MSAEPVARHRAAELKNHIEASMTELIGMVKQWQSLVGAGGALVGLGRKPALVVIDLARFWTEPGYAAYSPESAAVLVHVQDLLSHARDAGIPVIFTTQAYQSTEGGLVSATGMSQKFPGSDSLLAGSVATQLHSSLQPARGEHVLVKTQSSAFAHTHLASMLHFARVDTVIVTGVVTSGCVRATAADSLANGFRTMLVPECVSDILPGATAWTLFDITTKIGDVVPLAQLNAYLDALPRGAAQPAELWGVSS